MSVILDVNNLEVSFKLLDGIVHAVNKISFKVNSGEILGIVGESGSGKSQTVLAIMGLLAASASATGTIKFMGEELLNLKLSRLNQLRGNKLAIVFQDPMTALNPYLTIKSQMIEVLQLHQGMSAKDAALRALEMLDLVRIPGAKSRLSLYPHEFSGGMCQRVTIAMALLCRPELLIADEATTALDVTVQAQILQILKDLQREFNMAVVLITHDMGVVASVCDRVNVMYAGSLVETGGIREIFNNPYHPYTRALLASIPNMNANVVRLQTIPGEPPNLMNLPDGCPFQSRCANVHAQCYHGEIATEVLDNGSRQVKCNLLKKSTGVIDG